MDVHLFWPRDIKTDLCGLEGTTGLEPKWLRRAGVFNNIYKSCETRSETIEKLLTNLWESISWAT